MQHGGWVIQADLRGFLTFVQKFIEKEKTKKGCYT